MWPSRFESGGEPDHNLSSQSLPLLLLLLQLLRFIALRVKLTVQRRHIMIGAVSPKVRARDDVCVSSSRTRHVRG
jgi:hypothetical protein